MSRSRKIWLGVGAFVLTHGAFANAGDMPRIERPDDRRPEERSMRVTDHVRASFENAWAQGGEGGEGGVNLETVASDPVEYAMALQVIAAHYDAGLAAYAGGEQEAGAQMFAHGHSEVYAEMEELFKKLGVTSLGPSLEAAVSAAVDKKPIPEVRRRVEDVMKALAEALRPGPQSAAPQRLQVYLVGELIERAALQYSVALNDKTLDPYLDGLGFALAAKRAAAPVLGTLQSSDKKASAALEGALKLVQRAYPGINRPAKPVLAERELLIAAS